MRKIKFRAWDTVNEKIIDGSFFVIDGSSIWLKQDNNIMEITYKLELMQFTGLKDINGIEVYEGDIVKVNELERYVAQNGNNATRWIYKNMEVKYFNQSFFPQRIEEGEVIGNIYENKELIDGM